jgi:tetratricopeptide (TPR) repeat protein
MKKAVPIVEAEPEPGERLGELLTEADVLSRYGLEDKAVEKLEELLAEEPENLAAMSRLITLKLEAKDLAGVAELANRLVTEAQEQDEPEAWQKVRDQLLGEGFTVADGRVMPPTEEAEVEVDEESLVIAEDVDLGDADLSWLEEEPPAGEDQAPPAEALFEAEDEFFDLASELEEELRQEESIDGEELLLPGDEESIEDIVEGFKKGMAETLSDEDFDTHYNLGIAYREMGLIARSWLSVSKKRVSPSWPSSGTSEVWTHPRSRKTRRLAWCTSWVISIWRLATPKRPASALSRSTGSTPPIGMWSPSSRSWVAASHTKTSPIFGTNLPGLA